MTATTDQLEEVVRVVFRASDKAIGVTCATAEEHIQRTLEVLRDDLSEAEHLMRVLGRD